jgi:hypothetical protein
LKAVRIIHKKGTSMVIDTSIRITWIRTLFALSLADIIIPP